MTEFHEEYSKKNDVLTDVGYERVETRVGNDIREDRPGRLIRTTAETRCT